MKPSIYGLHRVISPLGVLPQAADQIDNTMICYENEILVDVETLNIDSASFTQIKHAANGDIQTMMDLIESIVSIRGKMQNPVTGSGGMFLGKVKQIGSALNIDLKVGDRIASLVSLSLTPLKIKKILRIDMEKDQVDIIGEAILFESGIYSLIPNDLPSNIVLSALDVAGAPAQVAKLVSPGDSVFILGAAGKSGLLCSYQAKKSAGKNGRVIGLINDTQQLADLESLHVCDEIIVGDARNPIEVLDSVLSVNNHQLVDVCINVVNVQNTEMTSILPTKDSGTVYFFSMATSFTKAALGAEGIKKECKMMIGNGYTSGHAQLTLDILRESKTMLEIFTRRYGKEESL